MSQGTVLGKMVSGTAGAGVAVKRAAHNARQDGKEEDARRRIMLLTREIGRLAVRGMDKGIDLTDAVAERYANIVAIREEIRAYEQAKRKAWTTCPHCGERIVAGMRYCGACGEELIC